MDKMENRDRVILLLGIIGICIIFTIVHIYTKQTKLETIFGIFGIGIGFEILYITYAESRIRDDGQVRNFFQSVKYVLVMFIVVVIAGLIFEVGMATMVGLLGFMIGVVSFFISYNALRQSEHSQTISEQALDVSENSLDLADSINNNIDSMMNAIFLNILTAIEQRNLVIQAIIRGGNTLTGSLWMTREDMDSLRELMEGHIIENRNLNKLIGRYNGLLERISENWVLPLYRFEDIGHVIWMQRFVLNNIPVNDDNRETRDNTIENVRTIIGLNDRIPINEETLARINETITEENRWDNFQENRQIIDNLFNTDEDSS